MSYSAELDGLPLNYDDIDDYSLEGFDGQEAPPLDQNTQLALFNYEYLTPTLLYMWLRDPRVVETIQRVQADAQTYLKEHPETKQLWAVARGDRYEVESNGSAINFVELDNPLPKYPGPSLEDAHRVVSEPQQWAWLILARELALSDEYDYAEFQNRTSEERS